MYHLQGFKPLGCTCDVTDYVIVSVVVRDYWFNGEVPSSSDAAVAARPHSRSVLTEPVHTRHGAVLENQRQG